MIKGCLVWWYSDNNVGYLSIVIKRWGMWWNRVLMVFIWCCVQMVSDLIVSCLNRVGLVV